MLYSHRGPWEGIPDFPICCQSGPRFPFPAKSGIGDSCFPIPAESGIGDSLPRFPAKSGIGGTGIGDFRVCLWLTHWQARSAR